MLKNINPRLLGEKMKFCSLNMSAHNETEVESLLMSPCWSTGQTHSNGVGPNDQYMLDGHKLLLEHDLDSLPSSDTEAQKGSIDALDNLLLNSQSMNTSLAELKPLPPFTGYTGHLSINGISGHHYHAISQRLADDNNNNSNSNNNNNSLSHNNNNNSCNVNHNYSQNHNSGNSPYSQHTNHNNNNNNNTNSSANCNGTNNNNNSSTNSNSSNSGGADHIVSSSTCVPDSVLNSDDQPCLHDVKLFSDHPDSKMYSVADSCVMASGNNNNNNNNSGSENGPDSVVSASLKIYTNDAKELSEYDMSSIEDIAAIIGSAIADTTVPNQIDQDHDHHNTESRDSWMDLDAWIDGACVQQDGKLIISHQDSLNEFVLPQSPHSLHGCNSIIQSSGSTLQNLLTHGYMPLLQNRLQNGPPLLIGHSSNKGEAPSSTSYCNGNSDLISTSTSPPGSVVSTTDNLMLNSGGGNGRYLSHANPNSLSNSHHYQLSMNIKTEGLCSPDLMNNNSNTNNNNYPHTTTIIGNGSSGQPGSKLKRSRTQKQKMNSSSASHSSGHMTPNGGSISPGPSSMGLSFQSGGDLGGLLGKEKPVHRCNICNRGFLNKSNIKVHLRTHTGEKPFRCDVCSKAFRQKAHLIKHQQIHKRIGRD